ncbi:MAG: Coenzyme F420 hydrogenase/dehydrogenase, beta subunit C-terminal domain [Candidatus Staskawiczbacteria bacterium]|nr:Coenzyme F420 hydrogenase/dehydrogenase, beta subunit C-terminal domain [Candidatus Staskawiczbacteria bacterium]
MSNINLKYYLGDIRKAFLGYSTDENIRINAASGGVVSGILLSLLKNNEITGALISRQKMVNGKIDAETFIATTPKEILSSQSSIYFYVPILDQIDKIRNFAGRLAVVGLPCQIKILRKLMEKDKELRKKLFLIGLFCGHASKKELIIKVLEQKNIQQKNIQKIIFRRGNWRGEMNIFLKNKKHLAFSFGDFSTYQNLFFYCEKRCLFCIDQTSQFADISCGDVWLSKYKNNQIKNSLIIARNNKTQNILNKMEKSNEIYLRNIASEDIYKIQKRSLIFHCHIKARSRIGKLFGYNISYDKNEQARWNDYISAFIILLNIKLSENKISEKIIFFIPKKIWYLYLILFKLLTSF